MKRSRIASSTCVSVRILSSKSGFLKIVIGTATLSQTAQETTARRDTEVRAAQAADAQRMREVEELRRKKTEKRNRQKAEKKARELADAAAKAAKERQDKQLLEADKIKRMYFPSYSNWSKYGFGIAFFA